MGPQAMLAWRPTCYACDAHDDTRQHLLDCVEYLPHGITYIHSHTVAVSALHHDICGNYMLSLAD